MTTIKILTETDLRAAVALDRGIVDCIEGAFVALAGQTPSAYKTSVAALQNQ